MTKRIQVDVTDHNSLQKWFGNRSREEALVVLSRNSLRMFPLATIYHENVRAEVWHTPNYLRQCVLRSLLIEVLAVKYPDLMTAQTLHAWHSRTLNLSNSLASLSKSMPDVQDLILSLIEPMEFAATTAGRGTFSDKGDSVAQLLAIDSMVSATHYFSGYEGPNLSLLQSYIGAAAAIDAGAVDKETEALDVYSRKLWHGSNMPRDIASAYNDAINLYGFDGPDWLFWREWYEGFVNGAPMDWGLQREVALIPEGEWHKGPKHLASRINEIVVKHNLRKEIFALKEQLKQTRVAEQPHHRLHNNPPEAIESQQYLKSEITLIWDLLEDAESEIAKPAPSPSALRVIAETLWEVSLRIGKYCASLADVAFKKSAEVVGETGTKTAIALLATNTAAQNEGVKAVAHAIWEFINTLPAG